MKKIANWLRSSRSSRRKKISAGDRLIEVVDARGGWSVVAARDDEPGDIVAMADEGETSVLSLVATKSGSEYVWLRVGTRPEGAVVTRGGGFGDYRLAPSSAQIERDISRVTGHRAKKR